MMLKRCLNFKSLVSKGKTLNQRHKMSHWEIDFKIDSNSVTLFRTILKKFLSLNRKIVTEEKEKMMRHRKRRPNNNNNNNQISKAGSFCFIAHNFNCFSKWSSLCDQDFFQSRSQINLHRFTVSHSLERYSKKRPNDLAFKNFCLKTLLSHYIFDLDSRTF